MFGQDRQSTRQFFVDVWQRREQSQHLQPLERQVLSVLLEHPHYQTVIESGELAVNADFPPHLGQDNPFLHMGLHLALRDQVNTDRPPGIRQIYQQLLAREADQHHCEHLMMECLMEHLWQAQQQQAPADEQAYLQALQELVRTTRR